MNLTRRIVWLGALLVPLMCGVYISLFNMLWHQASPQASLIHLAELELEAKGVPVCEMPNDFRIGSKTPSQHHCRWWRVPYEKGKFCGILNETLKPSQNCMEILFETDVPREVIGVFVETFMHPCVVLQRHRNSLHYKSIYDDVRCQVSGVR